MSISRGIWRSRLLLNRVVHAMMTKMLTVGCLLMLSALLSPALADSNSKPGSVCWPLNFAGITLGVSTDSQVQRLLGRGLFRKDEDGTDAGGRYYIDANRKATLHVVSCTDAVVCEVTLAEGVDSKIAPSERKLASTKWFTLAEGFGNWHALNLGSKKQEVFKNLGRPEKQVTDNEWRYSTTCACELPESFSLYFKNDHLFKIVLSAPAG